jgi:dCTP deaminase
MILSHDKIIEASANKQLIIEPFEEKQVQSASYDLRIGPQGATTTHRKIISIDTEAFITLEPGDMGVISSYEILKFDALHLARIGLRSKYARKGLHVTTGLQIDPGFEGRLFFGVINLTPKAVTLPFKDDFLSIEIHKLDTPTSKPYKGPHLNKIELGPEDIEHIVDGKGYALSDVITSLQSLSVNVGKLTTDVRRIASEAKFLKWILPFGFGIITVMISLLAVFIALK